MNAFRILTLSVLLGLMLNLAACADRQAASGPMVTLEESGKRHQVPAADFNEAAYLKRGYVKNTDGQGNTIYVFVPKQDYAEQPAFRGMDVLNPDNNRDTTDRGGGGLNPGMGAGDNWN